MDISLVIVTAGENLKSLSKAIDSTKSLVRERIVLYQASPPDKLVLEKIQGLLDPTDYLVTSTYKGNADIDRNYAYQNAGSEWILALDDDEWVPEETRRFIGRIVYSDAEVVWFNFRNLIDGVNIKDILGDDPHPRLWRNRQPPLIIWPSQAHTYPEIKTNLQYFTSHTITHDRRWKDVLSRHKSRSQVVGKDQADREVNFIEAVKRKLGK